MRESDFNMFIKAIMEIDKDLLMGTTEEERKMADEKYILNSMSDKEVVAKLFSVTSGFRMISYVLRNKSKKAPSTRGGYKLAYVVNIDCPSLSEYGEVYVKNVNGRWERQ